MAKQVIKLGLEFDTKAAIQSYRDLVSEMSKGGADPKAIKQFTAAIEKAETELAQLAAEGSTGFTDSKGIEQYQKKVLKTVTSMQQLALRMQEFSKSGENFPTSEVKKLEAEIEKLKKKITDAQKAAKEGLVKSLTTHGGFSKKEAEAIAETVKTEEQLIARLEEEKKLRDEIRKAAQPAAEKATRLIKDKAIARATSGSEVVMDTVGLKGKKGVKEAREAVAAAIQEGIDKGWKAEDVKKKAIETLRPAVQGTTKESIVAGLEAGFKTETVQKYLDEVEKKIAASSSIKKYHEANKSYGQIAGSSIEDYSQFITKSKEAEKAQQDLATAENQVNQAALNSANAQKKSADSAGQEAIKAEQAANGFMQMSNAQKDSLKSTEALEGGFNRLADRLKYIFGFTAMFNKLRQVIRSTFNDMQELDKAYASIAYVTNETVADLWSTYDDYAGMAEKLGQSTADVIKASAIYRQQGLDTAEALELTTDTMKLATIAGNDYSTATQEMTAALRGFKMEMTEGSHVSDVYSELAAHAAAKVDDIAQAMSRTASIANSAGMSFENTSAFLTQMIETTQESAENIGTSMKTIIARFTELKDNVAGTADSDFDDLDFNKVDKALKTVGVALKDTTGQFRNLDDVFLELSEKWSSLDRNTQRYIATVAAGSRQQSRFIALMDNYDRTIELINTAADSEGKADEQFSKAADTFEFKLNAIKTKWEEFKLSIMDSGFIKGLLDTVNSVMDRLKNVKMPQIAIFSTFAIMAAKNFILNFINTLKTTAQSFQQIGRNIGDKISKGLYQKTRRFKLSMELEVLKQDEERIKNQIKNLTKDPSISTILLNVDIVDNGKIMFDQLVDSFREGRTEAEATQMALAAVSQAFGEEVNETEAAADALYNHRTQLRENKTALQGLEQQLDINHEKQARNNLAMQKNQAIGQALTQTFHSLITSLSAMAAGTMKSSEAASMFGKTGVIAIGNITLSLITSKIAAEGLTAALWKAVWPLLAIAAAVGGIALLWHAIAKSNEETKEAVDLNIQLEKSEKRLQDAKKEASEKKEEIKNSETEKQNVKDITDEYQKLHKQKIKTTEESERERALADEIKDKYPEIVSGINSENGTIEISNSLLDDKLKKMDAEIEKQKELLRLKNIEINNRQDDTNYYKSVQKLQNIFGQGLTYDAANQMLTGSSNFGEEQIKSAKLDINFAKKIGYDKYDALDQDSVNKLLQAFDYVAGGESQFGNNWTEEQTKLIKEAKNELVNIRKENRNYDGHFQEAKEYLDSIENDMPNWEKSIRAGFSASQIKNGSFEVLKDDNKAKDFNAILTNGFNIDLDKGKIGTVDLTNEQKNELIGMRKNYNDILEKAKEGWNTNDDYYDILNDLQGTAKDIFKSWFPEKEDYEDFTDKGAMSNADFTQELLRKYYDNLTDWMIKSNTGQNASADLISAMGNVQQLSGEGGKESLNDALDTVKALEEAFKDIKDEDYYNKIRSLIPEGYELKNLQDLKNTLPQIFSSLPQDLSVNTALTLQHAFNTLKEEGRVGAEDYLDSVLKLLQQNKIPEDQWYEWLNLDWSKITNQEQFDKFKEEQIKRFKEAGYENAEAMFNEMQEYAKENGILNISIETDADYDKFIESLDTASEKVQALGDAIVSVTKDMKANGELGYATFEKLKKSIEDLDGIDIYDYVSIDDNGKITANEEQLKKLYEAQIKAKKEKIDQAKQEEELAIEQLTAQKKILKAQLDNMKYGDQIVLSYNEANEALIPQVENWMKIVSLMDKASGGNGNLGDFKASSSKIIKINDNNREAIAKQLQAEIDGIDAQIDLRQRTINKLNNDSKHIEQETQAQYREWQHQMAEAATATDELTKKQEDLAKAQQDVIDKQKALNKAIEDYNKLLYGSSNRQSGLDLLYNYKQAISAFSDEMARAQELMEDAGSVDESVSALSRYTNAAHQRLAYMNAENDRYNAGLVARRNQLLEGATSYTNERTGHTTTINFGNYVKYNANTGLMALDQKLIQDAKIADEWKDYIEKQVDDYNKISQESLKNQDEIRKLEKEIQKRREDAIKGYADFEKDIAETLKATYQEQVDNLKNKYDSMKEADDDYIDALQDAIDKQRKLRERENKWDDLAQKEKKLSLMNRDTSGANALETQRLEKEIQKDRESLLDESIDSAIENMQKLAEKQDELRQTEIELKEALLENTMYWNQQAEGVVQGFETAEDYVEWFKKTAIDLNEQTSAQFQITMDEAKKKFQGASEEIAWRIKDNMSKTGNSVTDTITITATEIKTITQTTADTFVDEVKNTFERTKKSFNENMESAIEKITSAQDALSQAVTKLNEAASAVKTIADEVDRLKYKEIEKEEKNQEVWHTGAEREARLDNMAEALSNNWGKEGYRNEEEFLNTYNNYQADAKSTWDSMAPLLQTKQELDNKGISYTLGDNGRTINTQTISLRYDRELVSLLEDLGFTKFDSYTNTTNPTTRYTKHFAQGGLVNYTGPAWVDGSNARPEAFLSAEDTERIGNAAKLLTNIPALNRSNISTNNSTYGDTNIEINLNIDHISSDVDIEEMLDRVKQEIVDVARPVGTNVILQQQV